MGRGQFTGSVLAGGLLCTESKYRWFSAPWTERPVSMGTDPNIGSCRWQSFLYGRISCGISVDQFFWLSSGDLSGSRTEFIFWALYGGLPEHVRRSGAAGRSSAPDPGLWEHTGRKSWNASYVDRKALWRRRTWSGEDPYADPGFKQDPDRKRYGTGDEADDPVCYRSGRGNHGVF